MTGEGGSLGAALIRSGVQAQRLSAMLCVTVITAIFASGCSDSATQRKSAQPAIRNEYDGYGSPILSGGSARGNSQWAIIVGINDYSNGWPELRTAVNGAVNVRNMLRDEFGYTESRIRLLLNEDGATILRSFNDVIASDEISATDSILFYFAGHGTTDGTLAGVDSVKSNIEIDGISLAEIRDALAKSRFLRKAIILDTCFSGEVFERIPQSAPYAKSTGVFVGLSACRSSDVAFDVSRDADFSPFTKHLLDVLTERVNSQEEDHTFNFTRLADEVSARVRNETSESQKPQWGFLGPGQGDFLFRETFRRLTPLEQERLRKEQQQRLAKTQRLIVASRNFRETYPQRSLLLAAEAVRANGAGEGMLVSEAHQNLRDALSEIGGLPLIGHDDAITCLAVSPNGRWLFSGSKDNTVRAWDLDSSNVGNPPVVLVKHREKVDAIAVSPDGTLLASASQDGSVRIVDLGTGSPSPTSPRLTRLHNSWVTCVAFSKDGKWLASASLDGLIRLWHLSNGNVPDYPILLQGHGAEERAVNAIQFTEDCRYLITVSNDKTARVWPIANAETDASPQPTVLRGHEGSVRCVAVSSVSRQIATGDAEGMIRLWTLESNGTAQAHKLLKGHNTGMLNTSVNALQFTPDGNWLISGSNDKTTKLWNVSSSDPQNTSKVIADQIGFVNCVVLSPSGKYAAVGSANNTLRLWALHEGRPTSNPVVLRGHEGGVRTICFSPDSKWIFSAGDDHVIRRWPTIGARNDASILVRGTNFSEDRFGNNGFEELSPSGKWLVTRTYQDDTVTLWGVDERGLSFKGIASIKATSAWFSPDEKWLAVSADGGPPRLYNLSNGTPLAQGMDLGGSYSDRISLNFSPDSRWLVCRSQEEESRPVRRRVVVWDLVGASGIFVKASINIDPNEDWDFEVSRVGLQTFIFDKEKTRGRIQSLNDPENAPLVLTGVPKRFDRWEFKNKRWLIIRNNDTLIIWDVTADNPNNTRFVVKPPEEDIEQIAVSPDDRWLAVATGSILEKQEQKHVLWVYDISRVPVVSAPHRLPDHTSEIFWIVFDRGGQRLATTSYDKTIRLWDLTSTDLRASCRVFKDIDVPSWVKFCSDSRWLLSGVSDRDARVWDLEFTGGVSSPVLLRGYEWVEAMPDSYRLLCSGRHVACIESLNLQELVDHAGRVAGRALTDEEQRLFLLDDQ